jgi:hypothetical protein
MLDHESETLPWGAMALTVTDADGFKVPIAEGA